MDQATQQNAALVEQMAAAASSLKSQANDLVQTVAVFKLDAHGSVVKTTARSSPPESLPFKGNQRRVVDASLTKTKPFSAKPPVVKPAQLPKTVVTAKATPAGGDGDWETF